MLTGYVGERLDQPTLQLLTATLGFAATLGGVLITQHFNRRGKAARRRYEAQSRWHEDNYRVCSAIVTKQQARKGLTSALVSRLLPVALYRSDHDRRGGPAAATETYGVS